MQVSGLSGATTIAAGYRHSVALKSDGTVWAWGNNEFSQLGDGTKTNRTTPVQVSGINLGVTGTIPTPTPSFNAIADTNSYGNADSYTNAL